MTALGDEERLGEFAPEEEQAANKRNNDKLQSRFITPAITADIFDETFIQNILRFVEQLNRHILFENRLATIGANTRRNVLDQ
jgi:hypothetical protein